MANKNFNTRIINKHDTEENWSKANFIPKQGELIIYDKDDTHDIARFKIGDGTTNVNELLFQDTNLSNFKSGSAILIDDVSPVTHNMGVKVRGKTLIPYPYAETRSTINGVSITYGEDGSVIFNGTAANNVYFKVFERFKLPAGEYYLSGTPTEGGTKVAFLYFFEVDNPNKTYNAYTTNGVACSLSGTEYSGRIYIARGQTVENLIFKPQLELGTTATAYTP